MLNVHACKIEFSSYDGEIKVYNVTKVLKPKRRALFTYSNLYLTNIKLVHTPSTYPQHIPLAHTPSTYP